MVGFLERNAAGSRGSGGSKADSDGGLPAGLVIAGPELGSLVIAADVAVRRIGCQAAAAALGDVAELALVDGGDEHEHPGVREISASLEELSLAEALRKLVECRSADPPLNLLVEA